MIRELKAVVVVLATFGAAAALGEDGTRVEIRSASTLELEAHKLVEAITTVDGAKKQLKVMRKKTPDGDQITLDVWGGTAPASEIPALLRESFPQLAGATITVSVAPAAEQPNEGDLPTGEGTVRKRVIIEKRQ